MSIFHRWVSPFVFIAFFVSCTTPISTSVSDARSSQSPQIVSSIAALSLTNTVRPSLTLPPSITPDQTQILQYEIAAATMVFAQTAAAQFPRVCKDNFYPGEFSPDGSWLGEFCYSKDDKDQVLTFSNMERHVLWKLLYRDYLFDPGESPDGAMSIVHWSSDEQYVYFNSFLNSSGAECFDRRPDVTDAGMGLFRLDLDTGNVKTILALKDTYGWYRFSFSPTGRRLVYGERGQELQIFDLKTGQVLNIHPDDEFRDSGGYTWSPDGLKFVYGAITSDDQGKSFNYSLRLVDADSGSEQILVESADACYGPLKWTEKNTLILVENYNELQVEFDLNLNRIISESTLTP